MKQEQSIDRRIQAKHGFGIQPESPFWSVQHPLPTDNTDNSTVNLLQKAAEDQRTEPVGVVEFHLKEGLNKARRAYAELSIFTQPGDKQGKAINHLADIIFSLEHAVRNINK